MASQYERDYWRRRIEKRLDEKITEAMETAGNPDYMDQLREAGVEKILEPYIGRIREAQALADEISRLSEEQDNIIKEIKEGLETTSYWKPSKLEEEARNFAWNRARGMMREMMAQDPLGRVILDIHDEKDRVMDKIMLATTSAKLARFVEEYLERL